MCRLTPHALIRQTSYCTLVVRFVELKGSVRGLVRATGGPHGPAGSPGVPGPQGAAGKHAATPTNTTPASLTASPAEPGGTSVVYGAGFGSGASISISSCGKVLAGGKANDFGPFVMDVKVSGAVGVFTLTATGSAGSEATAPLLIANK